MPASFQKFGGFSAILVGILSILYAVFFLIVAQSSPALGTGASWLILAVSGIFTSAAFTCLYLQVIATNEGFALWALAMGLLASMATFLHGIYELQLVMTINNADAALAGQLRAVQQTPSQADPAGLSTFLVMGLVVCIFSALISRTPRFPRLLGTLGMINALLLVILYFASAFSIHTLVLISGGLTSVILGPVWWIWLGAVMRN